MSQLLPLDRLAETGTLIAFRHPQPAYPFHVLIVPKKQVASLEALDPTDADFLTDLYATVQRLVKEFDPAEGLTLHPPIVGCRMNTACPRLLNDAAHLFLRIRSERSIN